MLPLWKKKKLPQMFLEDILPLRRNMNMKRRLVSDHIAAENIINILIFQSTTTTRPAMEAL